MNNAFELVVQCPSCKKDNRVELAYFAGSVTNNVLKELSSSDDIPTNRYSGTRLCACGKLIVTTVQTTACCKPDFSNDADGKEV
jgi:hypothetical protein